MQIARYCATVMNSTFNSNIPCADIQRCAKLCMNGAVYQSVHHNPHNANVIIALCDQATPAKILGIFLVSAERKEVAIAVQPYVPLSPSHAVHDPYRRWSFELSGRLFYNRCKKVEIVPVGGLKGHFGKTIFENSDLGEHIHVLPLAKVNILHSGISSHANLNIYQELVFQMEDNVTVEVSGETEGRDQGEEDLWVDFATL